MSDSETSPFTKSKSRHWVWIVPSVVLHLIILIAWLLLPEPEPRQPGERKLTIKEEQAEELQELVEEANVEELREKVSELQKIKETMLRIREDEMAQVSKFEQNMVTEAPKDLAALLREWAAIYSSVSDIYTGTKEKLDILREWHPKISKAAEKDVIEGLRLLPNLELYWAGIRGTYDELEAAFYEVAATQKEIEVKLEWIQDPAVGQRIEALKPQAEALETVFHETWRAVPASWKRARSYEFLTEDLEESIETVKRFRQSEIDGKAEAAAKINELEATIAETEAELKRTEAALATEEKQLKKLDRNEEKAAWKAARKASRDYKRKIGSLNQDLRGLERDLQRAPYQPDRGLQRSAQGIKNRLNHAVPEPTDAKILDQAVAEHQAMIDELETFAQSLEVPE